MSEQTAGPITRDVILILTVSVPEVRGDELTTEMERTFAAEVKDKAGAVGLTVPEWTPVWDRLPEEAQIPG